MSSDLLANMRATTESLVMAFDGPWSLEAALAPRAPECEHTVLPSSLGIPKRNNGEWTAYFKQIEAIGIDGKVSPLLTPRCPRWPEVDHHKMIIDDYLAVADERRAVCRSSVSATTPVGPYSNEYVWFLVFDETGQKIVSITEFFDSKAAADLLAKFVDAGLLKRH